MTQSSILSNDPEITQLVAEVLDGIADMDAGGLKGMMRLGAIIFKTAQMKLDELGGNKRWARRWSGRSIPIC